MESLKHMENMTTDEKVIHVAEKVYEIGKHIIEVDKQTIIRHKFYGVINKRVEQLTEINKEIDIHLGIVDESIKNINTVNFIDQKVPVINGGGIEIEMKVGRLLALTYETIKKGGTHDIACAEKFKAFSIEQDDKYNIGKNLDKWYKNTDVVWKWGVRIATFLLVLFILFKYIPAKEQNAELIKSIITLNQKLSISNQTIRILEAPTRGAILDTINKNNK